MGNIYYYRGSRNPKKGGLYMEQEENFPWKEAETIRKNYLELSNVEDDEECLAVFSLGGGKYAAVTAKKVQTPQEPRLHPESRGILIEEEDLESLMYVIASETCLYDLFAQEQAQELRRMIDQAAYISREVKKGELVPNTKEYDDPRGSLEGYEMAGVAGAVKEIARSAVSERPRRVILKTDPMEKKLLLAELYLMVPVPYWRYLNVIANGECTMTEANILIISRKADIVHQETRRYKTMGWTDFVNFGDQSEIREAHVRLGETPEQEQEDAQEAEEDGNFDLEELFRNYDVKDPLLKNCLSMCENFQSDYDTSYYVIPDIRNMLWNCEEEKWNEWQCILRRVLMDKDWSDKDDRDMMLLMFAFEKYPGGEDDRGKVMRENPYDVPGMLNFLKEKAGRKIGFKKLRANYLRRLVKLLNHEYMMLPEAEDMEFIEQEEEKNLLNVMQTDQLEKIMKERRK